MLFRSAEKAVKAARVSAAAALGVLTEEVYFTSGGTESDNAAVYGALTARKRTGKKIITSAVEHPAMIEACRRAENEGFEVVYLDVDDRGIIDMAQLESEMDDEVVFVSVMHVNNETGTVQPIEMIGSLKDAFNKKRRRNKTGMILHSFVWVVGDGASIAYVQDLLVHPDWQRRGIGARLLRDAMERFADRDRKSVV